MNEASVQHILDSEEVVELAFSLEDEGDLARLIRLILRKREEFLTGAAT